jgi:hypothetical protein
VRGGRVLYVWIGSVLHGPGLDGWMIPLIHRLLYRAYQDYWYGTIVLHVQLVGFEKTN